MESARGSTGSKWALQILKYADDVKPDPVLIDSLANLADCGGWGGKKIHISLFFANATSRISLKSHMLGGRFQDGRGVQTRQPFTGRLAEEKDCVCVRVCVYPSSVCARGGIIEQKKSGSETDERGQSEKKIAEAPPLASHSTKLISSSQLRLFF